MIEGHIDDVSYFLHSFSFLLLAAAPVIIFILIVPRGRENKENERGGEDGSALSGGSNRDFRGRGDRMANGPSRLGRSRGGPRTGRGPGGTRTFQSRDNNDRGGGFPRQIDTWNNPETENSISKAGELNVPIHRFVINVYRFLTQKCVSFQMNSHHQKIGITKNTQGL